VKRQAVAEEVVPFGEGTRVSKNAAKEWNKGGGAEKKKKSDRIQEAILTRIPFLVKDFK